MFWLRNLSWVCRIGKGRRINLEAYTEEWELLVGSSAHLVLLVLRRQTHLLHIVTYYPFRLSGILVYLGGWEHTNLAIGLTPCVYSTYLRTTIRCEL